MCLLGPWPWGHRCHSISAVRVILRIPLSRLHQTIRVPRANSELRARGVLLPPHSALEAPSSKTLDMQKQTGKSGGSGGGTPAKRGRPFGSTAGSGAAGAGAATAVGDPGAPAALVGPSLQVLSALSGNPLIRLLLQSNSAYVGL